MIFTPEVITYNIPIDLGISENKNNTITWKSFNQFSELLNVKHKTAISIFGDAKTKKS